MSRMGLMRYLDLRGPLLEIGPLITPFISSRTHNVYYADIRGRDDIFKEYLGIGEVFSAYNAKSPDDLYSKITPIDFIVKTSYMDAVGDMRFNGIFSSHVIEHTLDIIRHLTELYECLTHGGYLVMAIPDKRYGADRFRETTPFRDALDVYINGAPALARLTFDAYFSTHTCNISSLYHAGMVSFSDTALDVHRYEAASDRFDAVKRGEIVNAHNWVFTYTSFLAFLRDGLRSGLLLYELEYSSPPQGNSNEFHIVLKKSNAFNTSSEAREAEISKIQGIIEDVEGVGRPDALRQYCEDANNLYIYGAGAHGKGYFKLIQSWGIDVSGFIVSSGQPKDERLFDIPIYYIDTDFPAKGNCGIVVALQDDGWVKQTLDEQGLEYFKYAQ